MTRVIAHPWLWSSLPMYNRFAAQVSKIRVKDG